MMLTDPRWLVAASVLLCVPAVRAEWAVQPTFVHGLQYPYYDPECPVENRTSQDATWIAASFDCKNPKRVEVLNSYAQHYDPELTEEFWGTGDDIEAKDKHRYIITRRLVTGAEGTVYEAVDHITGKLVAIKKVTGVFDHGRANYAFKVWAEVKILKLASGSPDIMKLNQFILGSNAAYIVLDMLQEEVPRGQDPQSGDILTASAAGTLQQRVHQYIRGVAFLHAANLAHDDLSWHNVMLDESCNVAIIDLGNIAQARPVKDGPIMSQLPLQHEAHSFRRDIWQAGATILSWIAGVDVHHLSQHQTMRMKAEGIVKVFGYPAKEILAMYSEEVQSAFQAARPLAETALNLTKIAPNVDERFFALVKEMMRLDRNVTTAVELLNHPYLSELNKKDPLVIGPGDMSGLFEYAMQVVMNGSAEGTRQLLNEEIVSVV